MEKVSIIVPCYNVENTLPKCLESLLNQSLKEIKIIAVNDGSKDKTWEILKKYQKKYPEKLEILKKKNGGLGSARNLGLKYVNSEYVGFVDSDDYVKTDLYEKMLSLALEKNLDMVECDLVWEYDTRAKLDVTSTFSSKEEFIANGRILVCNKLYRTTILKEHQITFPIGIRYEDIPFTQTFMLYSKKFDHISYIGYHYVQYENSISHNQNEKVRDIFLSMNETLKEYNLNATNTEKEAIEYFFTRVLLGSSYLRICKIKNFKLKNQLIEETWETLNKTFPNWKKNPYLKKKSLKNSFYRIVNLFLLKKCSVFFRK